jgi:hypothetical protein
MAWILQSLHRCARYCQSLRFRKNYPVDVSIREPLKKFNDNRPLKTEAKTRIDTKTALRLGVTPVASLRVGRHGARGDAHICAIYARFGERRLASSFGTEPRAGRRHNRWSGSAFFVEERRRKRVERAFGHYLAPAIVDQLAQADDQLHLGGELREVTVMFADLSNFTSIADTMDPTQLMELTNTYFEVIVEAIEETGGYVDKFVGDSVMAVASTIFRTFDRVVASI